MKWKKVQREESKLVLPARVYKAGQWMAIVGFLLLAFSSWIGPFLDSWLPRWTALLPSLLLFVGLGVHFLCVPEEKEP